MTSGTVWVLPEVLSWIQVWGSEGQSMASMPLLSRNYLYTRRTHCNSIRSDSGSEDFILVPNSDQLFSMWRSVRLSKDMPPQSITDPLLSTHAQCYCRQHNTDQGISRFFHACNLYSVWSCSHLCREWRVSGEHANSDVHWWMPIELHCAKGRQPLVPSSWCVTVWYSY